MKDSLLIVLFFVLGLTGAYFHVLPEVFLAQNISSYVLYVLMFVVGFGIGSDMQAIKVVKEVNWKIVLVPLSVIVGSLVSTGLYAVFVKNLTVNESMAVGAGFGYYSLSSILISEMHGSTLGTIALLANVFRELFTLIFAPLLVLLFGKLAPVASGGATAMDTTLPIIMRSSGNEYGIIAVFSGIVLTILVPFIVTFILSI